jgi:hypothetical protein
MAGPYFFSITEDGALPLRKPGRLTRPATRLATLWRSRVTRSAGTVIVRRRAQLRGSSTEIFNSETSVAIREYGPGGLAP